MEVNISNKPAKIDRKEIIAAANFYAKTLMNTQLVRNLKIDIEFENLHNIDAQCNWEDRNVRPRPPAAEPVWGDVVQGVAELDGEDLTRWTPESDAQRFEKPQRRKQSVVCFQCANLYRGYPAQPGRQPGRDQAQHHGVADGHVHRLEDHIHRGGCRCQGDIGVACGRSRDSLPCDRDDAQAGGICQEGLTRLVNGVSGLGCARESDVVGFKTDAALGTTILIRRA